MGTTVGTSGDAGARKPLLNSSEARVSTRLEELCQRSGAVVFTKVRVADVVPIDGSALPADLFTYALKAHFDFVVTAEDLRALFVVEFDGPSHRSHRQQLNDERKDRICEHFELPILRLNARYLDYRARGIDLLGWMIENWFNAEAFAEAQENGIVPWEEFYTPAFVAFDGKRGGFPYWLGLPALHRLKRLYKEGKSYDQFVSRMLAVDGRGRYRSLGHVLVTPDAGVIAESGMRTQHFSFFPSDLLEEIVVIETVDAVECVIAGREAPIPRSAIDARIRAFDAKYEVRAWSGVSRGAMQTVMRK